MLDLFKYPVLTEKSTRLIESDQYTFDLDVKLTKTQIKTLIETIFGVKVSSVNTHRPPRKTRRVGVQRGSKSSSKRVIITLKPGQNLKLIPE
jgi:large subunit ribosomal protein L23|uniref:Large ribosomal subunit protein uL23c n=2 Tax=Botryococcus braunii TaxID=38881 RepID=A0A097KQA4_BOTBR|nr:ribosomal protein L23 [Botryococcus braunii]AIT95356.1 ribosomal protein L23 [Botryococcus braunii]CZT54116.1 ribosomal protein L23 [Botryococcus braunii Showa]